MYFGDKIFIKSVWLIQSQNNNKKRILGIDPGTNVMGYGVIDKDGKELSLVKLGYFRLSGSQFAIRKLKEILEHVQSLIQTYQPTEVSIEAPFYGENAQSMLKLGKAQGVAIAASLTQNLPVYEYAPKKIKVSVTGQGYSSKKQVAEMLKQLLSFDQEVSSYDATDGLAVAVCHALQKTPVQQNQSKYKDWESFLKDNPDRWSEGGD